MFFCFHQRRGSRYFIVTVSKEKKQKQQQQQQQQQQNHKEMSTAAAKTSLNHSQTLVFSQLSFLPVCPYNPHEAQLGQVQGPAPEFRQSQAQIQAE